MLLTYIWTELIGINLILTFATPNPIKTPNLEFIILHNNDMHARFEQTGALSTKCSVNDKINNKCYGGFARTAYIVKKFRNEAAQPGGTPVLYLNAGDTYTGTAWFAIFKDNITAEFLNVLQPDAISLGNHEFDEGVEGLTPFLNEVNFPVLTCNLDLHKVPQLTKTKSLKNSTIFYINGTKIGVIGYLTPATKNVTKPNDVEFFPEIESINQEAERLSNQNVKIIIALGHSGYQQDQAIGRNCPKVDLVIGGHSNTFLYNGKAPDIEIPEGPYPKTVMQKNGKEVPIVQAYAYTKYLGQLKVKFDMDGNLIDWSGKPILLNGTIPQDSEVLSLLEKYRPEIDEVEQKIIGQTNVVLDGSQKSCRQKECNLGNLLTDSMVFAGILDNNEINEKQWAEASIAFLQGGGIRSSIEAGNITRSDLLDVLPFTNKLYILEVYGSVIQEALDSEANSKGGLLQMSGVHVIFNVSKPIGKRTKQIKVLCTDCLIPEYEDLVMNKTYKIIITDFLLSGGDGHRFKYEGKPKVLKLNDIEAAASYISSKSPVYPGVEWRITIIGQNENQKSNGVKATLSSIVLLSLIIFNLE